MTIIDLKSSVVHHREDGIMHIHIKKNADMQLHDAVLVVEAIGKLGKNKKFPVYLDCGEFAFIDKEVRIFSASEGGNIYTLANAVAYQSLAQKLIADFYLTHNKPLIPTKVFSDKNEAFSWLKTFITPK